MNKILFTTSICANGHVIVSDAVVLSTIANLEAMPGVVNVRHEILDNTDEN